MKRIAIVAMLSALAAGCATAPQQQTATINALPPAPSPGEPDGVTGLGASQLRVAFGTPAFVRKDNGVEMWRYDGAACKAFFFLYPQGTELSVRHVETIPRPRDQAADPACLNALRASPPPVS